MGLELFSSARRIGSAADEGASLRQCLAPGVCGSKEWCKNKKAAAFACNGLPCLVPRRGLEPPRSYPLVPETSASTNSATWAFQSMCKLYSVKSGPQAGLRSFFHPSPTGGEGGQRKRPLLAQRPCQFGAQERTRTSTELPAST